MQPRDEAATPTSPSRCVQLNVLRPTPEPLPDATAVAQCTTLKHWRAAMLQRNGQLSMAWLLLALL